MRESTTVRVTSTFLLSLFMLTHSVTFGGSADTGQGQGRNQVGGTQGGGGDLSQGDGGSKDQKGSKDSKSSDKSSPDKSSGGKDQNAAADAAPIESEVLAFHGLRGDAAKIFVRVNSAFAGNSKPKAKSLLIYDSTLYKVIPTYRA